MTPSSRAMCPSLLLALFVFCIAVVAHPYPSRYSTYSREHYAARRSRTHLSFPSPLRYRQLKAQHLSTTPTTSDSRPSDANATDSHTPAHLRVSHSPLPATVGGGRTLPTSAFYRLKFTLSNNSSQRNATKRNATTSNHSSVNEVFPSETVAEVNTSNKLPESSHAEQRATSFKEKADDIFSAMGLNGLKQLVSSIASAKSTSWSHSASDDPHQAIPAEAEHAKNVTIPPNNISVKLAENVTLSDILQIIMKESQKETDAVAAATEQQNKTLHSGDWSQVLWNNSSSVRNDTKMGNDNESKEKTEMNGINGNATDDVSNTSYVLGDTMPHKAIDIIQKLHFLVHLVNETGSEKVNTSRSGNIHRNLNRIKPDELLQLTKRYVMNLYKAMFLQEASVKHQRGNSTIVLKSLAANARLSGDVEGTESDDVEDTDSGNESPGGEWGEKQETEPTPPLSAQVPSTESGEEVQPGSSGEDQGSEANEGNPSSSSIVASPTIDRSDSRGTSSGEGFQGSTDGEGDAGAITSTTVLPSPTTNPPTEDDIVSSNDPGAVMIPSSPSPSASPAGIPPMAVPMSAESGGSSRTEKNYGVRNGENVIQLAEMVYKLVREEGVFSLAVAPCDEVADWLPNVVRRLREELVEMQFYCIDTRTPRQDIKPLQRVFGDVATDFIQVAADDIKDSIPTELDMVLSWKGLQRWGMERGWRFLRGLRDSGTKFVLVSNNPGIVNMEATERAVNVRSSPLLFGEPRRVIGDVTQDNSVQLLLYAMDDIRDGF